MSDEAGYDSQGRAGDVGPHRAPAPSERGAHAEPDALHDPVRAERSRTARDFGVSGAGASDEVGPLRRPQGAPERSVPGPRASGPRGSDPRAAGVPDGRTDAELSEEQRGIGRGPAAEGAVPAAPPQAGSPQPGATRPGTAHTAGAESAAGSVALLPHGERDKLGLRLQQAVNRFVDEPRRAVEEADHVLEEAVRHVADTLAGQRRSLRAAWEDSDRQAETEELRIALRQYREVTERLLQL
ncbi:hypothetical protein ACFYVL_19410 [Streptomyces sp. NPDC004111]|uniref:hypothetical protein n=1 Tax=Streptomyces sp. NPDC004111 TaxID=3364690 RepID=UPI003697BE37